MIGRTGRYPSVITRPDPDRLARIVGGRIRDARVERGWSVFDLARAADVPATSLRAFELGRPVPFATLFRIAVALGVEARELMP